MHGALSLPQATSGEHTDGRRGADFVTLPLAAGAVEGARVPPIVYVAIENACVMKHGLRDCSKSEKKLMHAANEHAAPGDGALDDAHAPPGACERSEEDCCG